MTHSLSLRRRDFATFAARTLVFGLPSAGHAIASVTNLRQPGWRFCNKCMLMVHGPGPSGRCPAGGTHQPQGYSFEIHSRLTESSSGENPPPQDKWRKCRNCASLFYNGYSAKGACPGAKGHAMDSANQYFLSHDRAPLRFEQPEWRFCTKCHGLYFDGYPSKGVCAAGGSHNKAGYFFLMPHT